MQVIATIHIDNAQREEAHGETLHEILLDDFRALKIQYEQAQLKGKAVKRPLAIADIEALTPFHWGYEFDEIVETRGGFRRDYHQSTMGNLSAKCKRVLC